MYVGPERREKMRKIKAKQVIELDGIEMGLRKLYPQALDVERVFNDLGDSYYHSLTLKFDVKDTRFKTVERIATISFIISPTRPNQTGIVNKQITKPRSKNKYITDVCPFTTKEMILFDDYGYEITSGMYGVEAQDILEWV